MRPRYGTQLVVALSLALLALGVAGAAWAEPVGLYPQGDRYWLLLIPAYLLTTRLNLSFQRHNSNVGVTLVQVPLALGVVMVAPWHNLVARLAAAAVVGASRRHRPLQTLVNLALGAVEVGAAVAAATLAGPVLGHPGPALWLALFVGLLAGDLITCFALNAVLRVLGERITGSQIKEHLLVAVLTCTIFTGLAILAISAVHRDPSTLLVVAVLALALAVAYRGHRRTVDQQSATQRLHALAKDLGPVDVEEPQALDALERIRQLLHAEWVELSVVDQESPVSRRLTVRLDGTPESRLAERRETSARPLLRGDVMCTPLLTQTHVVGSLVVRNRIGTDREFDSRDFWLQQAVATELVTALDRGRLLRQLWRAANTDPLTALPNSRSTAGALDALLARRPDGVLVAAVAVDSFGEVNDALGHEVGDELLRAVAERLEVTVPSGVVGRVGGSSFAVAVPAADWGGDAALFGLHLRSHVEGEADLGAVGTSIRVSVGCTRAPEQGQDAGTLLRRAETAMHSAQRVHGGPVLWEPAYEVQGQRRLAVAAALREALHSGAVGVAFQPKVDAFRGSCTGVEALARWQHPALGDIAPEEFVPLAQASGLMGLLTKTVLRQALVACRDWQGGDEPIGVAVNVSAETLLARSFVTDVGDALRTTGVPAQRLTLELTEDVVVAEPHLAAERMHELRALGVKLSVDDFGTGYSSLTYLKGLPIDEVKVDKGFVAGVIADVGDQAVVQAVVTIAHTLGLRVVAEGVEQEEQHALLRGLGVDQLQGYLHARPMPGIDIAAWLAAPRLARR